MVSNKQCYCSHCKKELDMLVCREHEGIHYCPFCDKRLASELVRRKTDIKTIEVGTRSNGRKYTIRTNRQAFLTPEQWNELIRKLNYRQRLSAMFLIHTGGRIFEVQHLRPENIDVIAGLLTFEVTKKRSARGERRCEQRFVSLSTKFIAWYKTLDMKRAVRKDGYFDIMSDAGVNIWLKKILRENGVENWYMYSVHNLRKTHENWMIAIGHTLQRVSKRLGHMITTAQAKYVQETIFSKYQLELIEDILGDDIYVAK